MKKYYPTLKEARKERDARNKVHGEMYHVYRMPKGTRHHGQYAVCSEIEYLNTY